MTPTDEQIRLAIAHQAAEWFVAHRTRSLDEAGLASFAQWLRTSPVHIDEYLRIAAVAGELRNAARDPDLPREAWLAEAAAEAAGAEDPIPIAASPLGDASKAAPPRRWSGSRDGWDAGRRPAGWRLAWALTILGLAMTGILATVLLSGTPAQAYETAHGEQRAWRLPDGTTLRLNTDSAATVDFSAKERLVDLLRGQALFEVAHDPRRRFRVAAGGAELIAVGTQFDVYRYGQTVQLTVLEGRVAVFSSGHAPPPGNGRALPAGTLALTPGQRLRVVGGVIAGLPSKVGLHDAEAWLRGQIAFEQRPLGEVAAQFNRYARVPIEIDDPALRTIPVSGVFQATDSESFVAFLRTLSGVAVERSPARIRVLRQRPPSQP